MEKYTAKDLMILAHLTPLGMDALTDLVSNDMFGRDMNAIIDSAIITYWQYVKEEEDLAMSIDDPYDDEEDVKVIFDEPDKKAKEDRTADIDWNEMLDPWTFGGM